MPKPYDLDEVEAWAKNALQETYMLGADFDTAELAHALGDMLSQVQQKRNQKFRWRWK